MKVDHVGIAVRSIEEALSHYENLLGFTREGSPVLVDRYGVRVVVLCNREGERVELVEPLSEESPVYRSLKKGKYGCVHHLCYRCTEIEKTLERAVDAGATIVSPPGPGGVHEDSVVAFVLHPDFGLTEFVEVTR